MKLTHTKSEKPISGLGTISVGNKTFTIDLTYKDSKGREKEGKFTFKHSELPEGLPEGYELKSGKEYFVNISSDESTLRDIRPASGSFRLRCTDFARTDDDDFFILLGEGDYGPYSKFIANLTVQSGPHKGVVYPLYLPLTSGDRHRFNPDDDGMIELTGNPEKSAAIRMLFNFATYSGLADLDLEFPMDGDEPDYDPQLLLDILCKAVKKQKQDFTGLVSKGYIEALAELDDDTVSDNEPESAEEAEEEKPKKNGKHKKNWDEEE